MSSTIIDEEVEKAVDYIKRGQVVLYPADTLWAMTCDIDNHAAVMRIKKIKKDKSNGNMILAVDSVAMLKNYIASIHPRIETLLLYHDQPLSVIYEAHHELPDYLVSDKRTIALRIVKDMFSKKLIAKLGKAIISTMASEKASRFLPAEYKDVHTSIKQEVDYTVALQSTEITGIPSIIARFNHKGRLEFIRT